METVYLDNAATTQPVSSIMEAIKPYIETDWYNPSVLYSKGGNVKEKIESVRSNVAEEIGAWNDEIYFTSGASESNNWAIRGFVDECITENVKPLIITTHIEHKSILECVKNLYKIYKTAYRYVLVKCTGEIDIEDLEHTLNLASRINSNGEDKIKTLISIGLANSEIGTIQDIKTISHIAHSYNAILHTDATQAFGHVPIDVNILGVDLLTASAQKLGGLKGTGFLYKRRGIDIKPLIYGSQEKGQRGGTENVVGIIAFGEAIKQINYISEYQDISFLRDYMIEKLVKRFGCQVNGSRNNRLPNNVNVTFPQNITGEALIYVLDTDGIYISSGSACNSYSNKPSNVLMSIGLSEEEASRTLRITLSDKITKENIDYFIDRLERAMKLLIL